MKKSLVKITQFLLISSIPIIIFGIPYIYFDPFKVLFLYREWASFNYAKPRLCKYNYF